jgi:lambda family phage portal protein
VSARSAKILRHPAAIARGYEGAARHSALSAWAGAPVPPDVDLQAALRVLRARARDAAQNDDHMAYFLALVEDNVIGQHGIVVQARPRTVGGGHDRPAERRIEAAWELQGRRGTWDVTGMLSRVGFEQLAVRTVAQDGEVLIRIHEGDPDSPTGFAVELIDPEALDADYNDTLPNGNVVRMGVEMTRRRRPVAYHLHAEPASPWGGYASAYTASARVRVPASEILHVYLPHWVWATRGVPWARTALRRMKMLAGYEEAAITAARMAAAKSAKYTANPDMGPPGQLGELGADGRFSQEVEPGMIEQVPYGYDLETLDWSWPNTEHGEFVKAALRGVACGLGVSYNTLANDLEGVNYSSLRDGKLSERSLWMRLQAWWVEWVTQPVYRRWLAYAIRAGLVIRANGASFPLDRIEALSDANYQGRRWPWVDPLKDGQANQLAVRLGTRSISSIIREAGGEPSEVWDELAADLKALSALGIRPDLGAAPAAAQPPPDTDEDPPA